MFGGPGFGGMMGGFGPRPPRMHHHHHGMFMPPPPPMGCSGCGCGCGPGCLFSFIIIIGLVLSVFNITFSLLESLIGMMW